MPLNDSIEQRLVTELGEALLRALTAEAAVASAQDTITVLQAEVLRLTPSTQPVVQLAPDA